ncbi:hypothetical protein GCM10025868_09920 [Angustibacter aerolatus]|uniref:Uncharacterized protein n=1 Tax=Angustibacter aerolatus TaxID=1162965 RepID=A0ABQ6JFP4_9ACTN|nr:hypothetical protein GCM10025868_09920 [Angustibacter aerolatus]
MFCSTENFGTRERLLVDERQSQVVRRLGRAQGHRGAVDQHLPLVGDVRAGEHLDERRLAGAVRADQTVHLARPEGGRHLGQGGDRPEALADVTDLDDGGAAEVRRVCLAHDQPALTASGCSVANAS